MKKLFLGLLAGVAMLFTACQDEEVKAVVDGDTTVAITAQLPTGVSTRAYADGTTATKLTYAIYETGQTTPLITGNATFDNLKTTVNVRLANGKTYDMLFWAQADGAPYTFNTATQKVTVDYEAAVGQDEKRDAFFKAERLTVDGTIDKTIQLKRPFAQLNVGAQDFDAAKTAGFEATQTTVKVDNVYTTLNLLNGTVEGETSVTYIAAALPTEDFPVRLTPAAKYMSMDYLLVADDKALTNVTFTATNGTHNVERLYTNVPVRRNYRTNIYGNILTEEANFNIEIVPGFDEPANNVPVFETTVSNQEQMEDALATDAENIIINIDGSASFDKSDFYAQLGGASTKTITIDGGAAGAELNIISGYRNHIITKNNATLILKNLTISSNYKVEGSTWDDYGIIFDCPTIIENVTFTRQVALGKNQKHELSKVTINQTAATGDMYALWLQAGVDVTLKDCVINSINPTSGKSNRAIKIADEYITNPQLTKLAVSGPTFKSQKKAAVLVTSTAGANIVWGEGNDISQVQADNVNAVWNDADRTAAWDLVTVTGCTKKQE